MFAGIHTHKKRWNVFEGGRTLISALPVTRSEFDSWNSYGTCFAAGQRLSAIDALNVPRILQPLMALTSGTRLGP